MNFEFNIWDNLFSGIGILISTLATFGIYKLSNQMTIRDKYDHEVKITKQLKRIAMFSKVILADAQKYHPLRADSKNNTYYKQGAELYSIIPEFGVQFIIMPKDEKIPVGLIPFEWIELIREHDSEDCKPIIVCKFKGEKLFRNYRSPFKEIKYMYENHSYIEDSDPKFLKLTFIKPKTSFK